MEKIPIKIERDIHLPSLNDVLTTALEGGSNYWYSFEEEASEQVRKYKGVYCEEIHGSKSFFHQTWGEALLLAVMQGEEIKVHDLWTRERIGTISLKTIKAGLQKMANDNRPEIECLYGHEMSADYDAFDADVIFQYICLGEIIYG